MEDLVQSLQKEKIQLALRQNEQGIIYGITYIDYQNKCVFNGSDLGKQYSANQVQDRCKQEQYQLHVQAGKQRQDVLQIDDIKQPIEIKDDYGVNTNTPILTNELIKG